MGVADPPASCLCKTVESLLAAVALLSAHARFAHTHSSAIALRRLRAWTHTHPQSECENRESSQCKQHVVRTVQDRKLRVDRNCDPCWGRERTIASLSIDAAPAESCSWPHVHKRANCVELILYQCITMDRFKGLETRQATWAARGTAAKKSHGPKKHFYGREEGLPES